MLHTQQTVEAWRSVFYITAGIYAFGTIFYGLFGSGKLQSWAIPPKSPPGVEVEMNDILVDKNEKKLEN